MSENHGGLDLRAELARIDRDRAETQKLMAESRRFDDGRQAELQRMLEETKKFVAEQHKLMAEAAKLDKERWWFPWLQLLTITVSSAAIGAVVGRLFH
jgi:hypothetical protein